MSAPDKDGWIAHTPGDGPVEPEALVAIKCRTGDRCEDPMPARGYYWGELGDSTIIEYRVADPVAVAAGLFAQPEPDGFTHESPIRAFTDWTVNGRYAIGKGFRPSLQHLTVYLDAMERLEGWALLQLLEAASGSPSFVFRRPDSLIAKEETDRG